MLPGNGRHLPSAGCVNVIVISVSIVFQLRTLRGYNSSSLFHFYTPLGPSINFTAHNIVLCITHTHNGRDDPGNLTDFWLVSNSSEEGCEINIEGRSLFAVVR